MLSLVLGSELRNSLRHGLPLDKDDLKAYVLCIVVLFGRNMEQTEIMIFPLEFRLFHREENDLKTDYSKKEKTVRISFLIIQQKRQSSEIPAELFNKRKRIGIPFQTLHKREKHI
jgi:hypothetical protein